MSEMVRLPALGESVSEATVTRWLKRPGDAVTEGEPLVEVSTDKVDTEVLSPFTGILAEVLVDEDATVDVGTVLAVIGEWSAEYMSPYPLPAGPVESLVREPAPIPEPVVTEPAEATDHGYLSLLVRKAVKERGIDLSAIVGTGAGCRIRRADLPAPTVSSTLSHATSGLAQLTMAMEFDVTGLDHSGAGAVPLLGRYCSAVADGLRAVPAIHATIDPDGVVASGPSEPRIVVGEPTGDAGFPVYAAAADGYLYDTPRVIEPRVAAVSFGAVRAVPRIAVVGGGDAITFGRVLTATVSYDPRAVTPTDAQQFLTSLRMSLTHRR